MANPSKKKGTTYENEVLEQLQKIWPTVTRSAAGTESNDFTGPFPIEAKKRRVWNVREWVRKLERVSEGRWMLFIAEGDRRRADAVGDVVVLPVGFALELLDLVETLT